VFSAFSWEEIEHESYRFVDGRRAGGRGWFRHDGRRATSFGWSVWQEVLLPPVVLRAGFLRLWSQEVRRLVQPDACSQVSLLVRRAELLRSRTVLQHLLRAGLRLVLCPVVRL